MNPDQVRTGRRAFEEAKAQTQPETQPGSPMKEPLSPQSENATLPSSLARVIAHLARDNDSVEDLQQDARLHLWVAEMLRPGQTRSWYAQNSVQDLKNSRRLGKSVDSAKRQKGRRSIEDDPECNPDWDISPSFLPDLMIREELSHLRSELDSCNATILDLLWDGFGPAEIAIKVGMSHRAVNKHRRFIGETARRLRSCERRK